jgi:hypothetical protein
MSLRSLGPQPTKGCPVTAVWCCLSAARAAIRSGLWGSVRVDGASFVTMFVTKPTGEAGSGPSRPAGSSVPELGPGVTPSLAFGDQGSKLMTPSTPGGLAPELRAWEAIRRLITAAIDEGSVRPDLAGADLLALVSGVPRDPRLGRGPRSLRRDGAGWHAAAMRAPPENHHRPDGRCRGSRRPRPPASVPSAASMTRAIACAVIRVSVLRSWFEQSGHVSPVP